jgi:hypothetical protein
MANSNQPNSIWRNRRMVLVVLAITSLAYILITYRAAELSHQGNVSALHAFLINCTVALPEIAIWVLATIAALRFKQYAHAIRGSADGKAMNFIANALLLIVGYIILLSVAGAVMMLSKNSSYLNLTVNLGNHLPLAVALVAAAYFCAGALRLNKLVSLRMRQRWQLIITGTFAVIATLYVWDFNNRVPSLHGHEGVPQFVLPVGTLIFTYALPYVIVWALGVYACISIANYARHTKGTIYRELLGNLYRGVLLVFICTFLAQLFVVSDVSLEHFSFLLFLIYCLLLAAVAGFIMIYQASARLNTLENI